MIQRLDKVQHDPVEEEENDEDVEEQLSTQRSTISHRTSISRECKCSINKI